MIAVVYIHCWVVCFSQNVNQCGNSSHKFQLALRPEQRQRGGQFSLPAIKAARCSAAILPPSAASSCSSRWASDYKTNLSLHGLRLLPSARPATGQARQLLGSFCPTSAQTCNYLQFCTCHNLQTITFLVSWGLQTVRHTLFQSRELRADEKGAGPSGPLHSSKVRQCEKEIFSKILMVTNKVTQAVTSV